MQRTYRYLSFALIVLGLYCLHEAIVPFTGLGFDPIRSIGYGTPASDTVETPVAEPAPNTLDSTDNLAANPNGNELPEASIPEPPKIESPPKPEDTVEGPASTPAEGDHWSTDLFPVFLEDVQFTQPKIDITKYANYQPHQYNGKPGGKTFATYLCTRNTSIHNPYFAATQQLVYRNLWSPTIASKQHPFTVFVAPFIPQEQRDILSGAGAIVREIELVAWHPKSAVNGRWRDQFSKLHFWNQTDFSRIAYMDSDAFPLVNIDDIFEHVTTQRCNAELVDPEDKASEGGICDYVMASVPDLYDSPDGHKSLNGGVLVLEPNVAMYARLIRNMAKTDSYSEMFAEQSYLNWQFGQDSAFPATLLDRAYNGVAPAEEDKGKLKIVHEKLWSPMFGPEWTKGLFDENWTEMVAFYDSEAFKIARERDGLLGALK